MKLHIIIIIFNIFYVFSKKLHSLLIPEFNVVCKFLGELFDLFVLMMDLGIYYYWYLFTILKFLCLNGKTLSYDSRESKFSL